MDWIGDVIVSEGIFNRLAYDHLSFVRSTCVLCVACSSEEWCTFGRVNSLVLVRLAYPAELHSIQSTMEGMTSCSSYHPVSRFYDAAIQV